jgi:aminoglycoside phosphotransferase (APT) family kinase protein
MAESFDPKLLARLVCEHVDISPGDLSFEPIATGHFNTSYFVEGAERSMVLRIAPPDDAGFVFYERGMMAQEPGIHRLVREYTSVPVAEIIAYDTSRKHVDRDYLLIERLPGRALSDCQLTLKQFDKVLEQTGRYLREIHEITSEYYGYLGEHNCMQPQRSWADAFRIMWSKLVDDVAEAGYYDISEANQIKKLLDIHISLFDRPVTSRLLHMDIWSQNILIDEEANVTGIVDFDRALWGDKEIEFAVLDYCGISEPAFWRGYGKERDLSPEAQIRRLFYLAYEVQKYIPINHWRKRSPESAWRYKQNSMAIIRRIAES